METKTKWWLTLIGTICAAIGAFLLQSCNVTRKITTSSEFHRNGDTTIVIQSKTTETYDARKNFNTYGY